MIEESREPWAHVLRTVAAHREILDEIQCILADDEADEGAHWLLGVLATIYRDQHPGFDPSWIGES